MAKREFQVKIDKRTKPKFVAKQNFTRYIDCISTTEVTDGWGEKPFDTYDEAEEYAKEQIKKQGVRGRYIIVQFHAFCNGEKALVIGKDEKPKQFAIFCMQYAISCGEREVIIYHGIIEAYDRIEAQKKTQHLPYSYAKRCYQLNDKEEIIAKQKLYDFVRDNSINTQPVDYSKFKGVKKENRLKIIPLSKITGGRFD